MHLFIIIIMIVFHIGLLKSTASPGQHSAEWANICFKAVTCEDSF